VTPNEPFVAVDVASKCINPAGRRKSMLPGFGLRFLSDPLLFVLLSRKYCREPRTAWNRDGLVHVPVLTG
jgi:hypothetical protein